MLVFGGKKRGGENIVWKGTFNISVLYLETTLGFFYFLNKLQKEWENFKFEKRGHNLEIEKYQGR